MARVMEFAGVGTDEDGVKTPYLCTLIHDAEDDVWQLRFEWFGQPPIERIARGGEVSTLLFPVMFDRRSQTGRAPRSA